MFGKRKSFFFSPFPLVLSGTFVMFCVHVVLFYSLRIPCAGFIFPFNETTRSIFSLIHCTYICICFGLLLQHRRFTIFLQHFRVSCILFCTYIKYIYAIWCVCVLCILCCWLSLSFSLFCLFVKTNLFCTRTAHFFLLRTCFSVSCCPIGNETKRWEIESKYEQWQMPRYRTINCMSHCCLLLNTSFGMWMIWKAHE